MNASEGSLVSIMSFGGKVNLVDTFSCAGVHQFKFGVDYRRLNPRAAYGTGYGTLFPPATRSLWSDCEPRPLAADEPFFRECGALLIVCSGHVESHESPGTILTYGLRWINTAPGWVSAFRFTPRK